MTYYPVGPKQLDPNVHSQFNVLAYGADPTGVTDSAPAINAAIAAANALNAGAFHAGNAVVFLPAGVYRVNSALTGLAPCVHLRGAMRAEAVSGFPGGTVIKSYVYDTLLQVGDWTAGNVSHESSVSGIHFECMVDQTAQAGWGIDSGSQTIAVNAAARTFTRSAGSYLTDGFVPGQRVEGSGFTAPGNNVAFVIQTVTATVMTAVAASWLVLVDEAAAAARHVKSVFLSAAGAGIEMRGSVSVKIVDCTIAGFPIGVVWDGAELCQIIDSIVATGNNGYTAFATNGVGVLMTAGTERGRGWTVPGSTNGNRIAGGTFGGNHQDIVVAGINNLVEHVYFLTTNGLTNGCAVAFNGCSQITVRDCTMEGYIGAGTRVFSFPANCLGLHVTACFMGGKQQGYDIPVGSQVYQLVSIGNRYGGPDGGSYVINGAARITDFVSIGDWCPQSGVALADTDQCNGAMLVLARDSSAAAYPMGVSINRMLPAQAVIDAQLVDNAFPLIKIYNGTVRRYRHNSPDRFHHDLDWNIYKNGHDGGGTKVYKSEISIVSGAGNTTIVTHTPPANCLVKITAKVVQWSDTTDARHGVWTISRNATVSAGVISFNAASNNDVPAETDATFTAIVPIITNSGGDFIVTVGQHGTDTSQAYVDCEIEICVR